MSAFDAAAYAGGQTVPSVARLYSNTSSDLVSASPYASHASHRYAVRFTGIGSAYFRIWITSILMTVLSLGLYYPWAKARRLQYFYEHTQVAGHALNFHGRPWAMLRGHLLALGLFGAYLFAGRQAEWAGALAALVLAGLWPALLVQSMRFRLANTSWKGQRFHFTGRLKDAYLILLKPVALVAGLTALSAVAAAWIGKGSVALAGGLVGATLVLSAYAMVPYTWWLIKRFQHGHYALHDQQMRFRAPARAVFAVFLKTVGMGIVSALIALALFALILALGWVGLPAGQTAQAKDAVQSALPLLLLLMFLSQMAPRAYFVARMQDLVWSETGNRWIRFKSRLNARDYLWLSLKNAALTLCTLGLYWPFAAVASTQARLEAVTVHTRLSVASWPPAQAHAATGGAAADASIDMLGMDVGL